MTVKLPALGARHVCLRMWDGYGSRHAGGSLVRRSVVGRDRSGSRRGLALTLVAASISGIRAVAAATLSSPCANAAPRDEMIARARRVKVQVDVLDKQTEILSEDFNDAQERHTQPRQTGEGRRQETQATTKRTKAMQARLDSRAASMYRNGPRLRGRAARRIGLRGVRQTWDFLREQNEDDARTVADLKVAKAEQAEARKTLEQRTDQAAAVSRNLASSQEVDRRPSSPTANECFRDSKRRSLHSIGPKSEGVPSEAARAVSQVRIRVVAPSRHRHELLGLRSSQSRSDTSVRGTSGAHKARTPSTAAGSPCTSTGRSEFGCHG